MRYYELEPRLNGLQNGLDRLLSIYEKRMKSGTPFLDNEANRVYDMLKMVGSEHNVSYLAVREEKTGKKHILRRPNDYRVRQEEGELVLSIGPRRAPTIEMKFSSINWIEVVPYEEVIGSDTVPVDTSQVGPLGSKVTIAIKPIGPNKVYQVPEKGLSSSDSQRHASDSQRYKQFDSSDVLGAFRESRENAFPTIEEPSLEERAQERPKRRRIVHGSEEVLLETWVELRLSRRYGPQRARQVLEAFEKERERQRKVRS